MHTLFVTAHAASGLVALAAGLMALRRRRAFAVYLWSLVASIAFAAAAVAIHWEDLGVSTRVVFSGLIGLGAYMIARAVLAQRLIQAEDPPRAPRYHDHVGFTLIALVEALVIVAMLDLGAPLWTVVLAGLGIAAAGHVALRAEKHQIEVS